MTDLVMTSEGHQGGRTWMDGLIRVESCVLMGNSLSCPQMTELMQQMRDPSQTLGGSVGSIPQSIVSAGGSDTSLQKALCGQGVHSTPASNLKFTEAMRKAQHDGGPSIFTPKMATSKSYTAGLSHSAGTVSSGQLTGFGGIELCRFLFSGQRFANRKSVPV